MKIYENGICREITEEEQAKYVVELSPELRIAELKQKLSETDYNVLKIVEGETTLIKCAEIIAQRRVWRKEINALEEQIKKGE